MFVGGRRRRVTLLRIGEKQIDDAVAEARYRAVLTALGVTERARMPQETIAHLCEWYKSTVIPARGNRPSTRQQDVDVRRLQDVLLQMGTAEPSTAEQINAVGHL